jgi:hypothetical protein
VTATFVVGDRELIDQLAEHTATDGECVLWLAGDQLILTTDGLRPPASVVFHMSTGQWVEDPVQVCGNTDCVRGEHLVHRPYKYDLSQQEEDLVERASRPSLASLYREGRSRGLLTRSSQYQ